MGQDASYNKGIKTTQTKCENRLISDVLLSYLELGEDIFGCLGVRTTFELFRILVFKSLKVKLFNFCRRILNFLKKGTLNTSILFVETITRDF